MLASCIAEDVDTGQEVGMAGGHKGTGVLLTPLDQGKLPPPLLAAQFIHSRRVAGPCQCEGEALMETQTDPFKHKPPETVGESLDHRLPS